ncbi:uncharacterized protein RSE6_01573 [Rhynchosporium secalis]|uniref:Carbohydrate-binding module family 18 protein n=1 Tax=Rhynchosporium secalis TaxID=38038 RepID=A0A1E1LY37_RHYSE|nr:uncharacterized protein RSE6_01573 [Rhynchosporium secalis]
MLFTPFFFSALPFLAAVSSAIPNAGKAVKETRQFKCSLSIKTLSTDTCDIVVVRFGITKANFVAWNPSVGSGCTGFVGGTSYCIRGSGTGSPVTSALTSSATVSPSSTSSSVAPVSTLSKDGSCGGTAGLSCKGTSFGDCCSANGFCGATTGHCQAGCQQQFGTCSADSGNISIDGSCGASNKKTCSGSAFGGNYCGSTTAHCQAGCQSGFGTCDVSAGTISTDGSCGGNGKKTCPGSTFGNCCSVAGYCGSTSDHCKIGCQSAFGDCETNNISIDGQCGANGKTCTGSTFGTCCSAGGWCGSTAGHCAVDAKCQANFGICTSTNLSSDDCCSASGYCGTGVNFCAQGCQKGSSSACTTTNIPSLTGECGKNNLVCAGGPFVGTCCSTSGFCGKGTGFPC